MRHPLVALLCLALLALPACGREDALEELQLREIDGNVDVVRDGEVQDVSGTFDLQVGDLVVTRRKGLAEFALEGGDTVRTVELQGESAVLVRSTTAVEAREGHVLVRANAPTVATFNDVRARVTRGRLRIDRGFGSTRVSVYTGGRASLTAPGERDLTIPSLRQANIVAADFPDAVTPYRIDPQDVWDQSELPSVLELEDSLEELARGFSNQLGGARPELPYFAALNDGAAEFVRPFLDQKPVDLLVAFIIATKAPGSPGGNLDKAFRYRRQGGSWGVVAAILGADPGAVLTQLKALIVGSQVAGKRGGRGARFTVAAAEASQDDAGQTTTSTTTTTTGGNEAPPEQDQPAPPPEDDEEKPKDDGEKPKECTDTADCTFQEIGEQVNPSPSPSPSDGP